MVDVRFADELLHLLADRAVYWPRRATLAVADLHLGKPAAFRTSGIPVPEAATTRDLDRLSALIAAHAPRRLLILGDLLHARAGRAPQNMSAFANWRASHPALDIILVRGNHDRSAGDPPADWNLRTVDEGFADPDDTPLTFAHDPSFSAPHNPFTLCGHLHPAIVIHDGATSIRAACFWVRHHHRRIILPAFGSFTGSMSIAPTAGDEIIAVHDNQIARVPTIIIPRDPSRSPRPLRT